MVSVGPPCPAVGKLPVRPGDEPRRAPSRLIRARRGPVTRDRGEDPGRSRRERRAGAGVRGTSGGRAAAASRGPTAPMTPTATSTQRLPRPDDSSRAVLPPRTPASVISAGDTPVRSLRERSACRGVAGGLPGGCRGRPGGCSDRPYRRSPAHPPLRICRTGGGPAVRRTGEPPARQRRAAPGTEGTGSGGRPGRTAPGAPPGRA